MRSILTITEDGTKLAFDMESTRLERAVRIEALCSRAGVWASRARTIVCTADSYYSQCT